MVVFFSKKKKAALTFKCIPMGTFCHNCWNAYFCWAFETDTWALARCRYLKNWRRCLRISGFTLTFLVVPNKAVQRCYKRFFIHNGNLKLVAAKISVKLSFTVKAIQGKLHFKTTICNHFSSMFIYTHAKIQLYHGSNRGKNQTRPTWNHHLLYGELHPWGHCSQGVLDAVVEQKGVEGEAAWVDEGRYQVLRIVEERQGAHVPVDMRLTISSKQTPRRNIILAFSRRLKNNSNKGSMPCV